MSKQTEIPDELLEQAVEVLNKYSHLNTHSWYWNDKSNRVENTAMQPNAGTFDPMSALCLAEYYRLKNAPALKKELSKAAFMNREKMLEDTVNEVATSHAVLLRLAESCEGVEERRARVMLDYIGEALHGSLTILKAIKLKNKQE